MDTLIGQKLGQYEIVEQIGQGGMGMVYRARQTSIGREVAIKVLPRLLIAQEQQYLERFYREAQVAAQLQHPHIVPVHDFGEQDGTPYIVMAYIGSGSLLDHIKQHGQMSMNDVLNVTRQITSALDYAHQRGIVHRDLKPGNVLFDENGNAYLADFGLAKMAGSDALTASGAMMGTPDYMAPDWSNEGDPNLSVDLYALGVMLYQMLAGEVPYKASTPMGILMKHLSSPIPDLIAVRDDLPSSVGMVVRKAMAKTANVRYATALDLMDALQAAVDRPHSDRFQQPDKPEGQYFIPNAWGLMGFKAAEQALGKEDQIAVLVEAGLGHLLNNPPPDNLNREFPFEAVSAIQKVIYEVYGRRGMQAVGRLTGSLTQAYAQARFTGIMKMGFALVRAAPPAMKMKIGLETMARTYNQMTDAVVEVDENERYWIWRMKRCYLCYGWHADEAVCFAQVGTLEAGLRLVEDRAYRVVETECMAKGDEACVFLIEKPSRHD